MVKLLMRRAPLDWIDSEYEQEDTETQRGTEVAERERIRRRLMGSSSTLGLGSAAGGASKPGPRQWKDSSEAHRVSRRRGARRDGASDSGVTLETVVVEKPKMDWIDLRVCICRMDRSDARGESWEEAEAAGALLPA